MVFVAVGPEESEGGESSHWPFAAEHGAREDFVFGLGQFLVGDTLGKHFSVNVGDSSEVVLGFVGVAAQEGEEGSGLVVVLVGKLGSVGVAGVDE